jgi:predicted transcriptional regulator
MSNELYLAILGIVYMVVKEYFDMKRAERASLKVDAQSEKIEEIHHATNSMKDALVKATGEAEFAKGVKSETDKAEGRQHPGNPDRL